MVQPNSHKRDALQSQRQHDESSAEKKFIKANFTIHKIGLLVNQDKLFLTYKNMSYVK